MECGLGAKIVGLGGVQVLINIVSKGKNKDMVRYALGALRNLANDPAIQRQLVDQGLLEACTHISTYYGEGDKFDDGSTPVEHAACIVRNLCGNDQIRNLVRKNNGLQHLSKQVDPASQNICEDYVRLKPDLNPADVMVAYLSSNGDVIPELCGTTDNANPAFPSSCAHLKGDIGARAAWGAILYMMNQLWLQYEAPRPDLAELLELMEEDKAKEAAKKDKKNQKQGGDALATDVPQDLEHGHEGEEADELDPTLAHLLVASPLHSPGRPPREEREDGSHAAAGVAGGAGAGGGKVVNVLKLESPRGAGTGAAVEVTGGGGQGDVAALLRTGVATLKRDPGPQARESAVMLLEMALGLLDAGAPPAAHLAPTPAAPHPAAAALAAATAEDGVRKAKQAPAAAAGDGEGSVKDAVCV